MTKKEIIEEQTAEETPIQVEEAVDSATDDEPKLAKAGKRSSKSLKEAEEKAAKEERKATGDTTPQSDEATAEKRGPAPKTRSRLARRSKTFRKLAEKIEAGKVYSLTEALALAAATSPTKFDATVELHVNLGVDPRQADQNVRGTVMLPGGTGKTVRVAVLAPADQQEAARKAGADVVGEDELLAQLDKEQLNFDVLIATPQLMPKLGKYARLLGPRGLMPNPKSGTVTPKVVDAVRDAKAGRVEYRIDKQAIVHLGIGKVSFDQIKLLENARAFLASLNAARPASVKGTYIKSIAASTTMGPGITVDIANL
ncbi:MAG TPA: 50S ribosomal protein L1 [Candidatus Acidoferrum sp.]|nr:50S ribosomal protein L1 [Candidatus Acidoferrum sp.]